MHAPKYMPLKLLLSSQLSPIMSTNYYYYLYCLDIGTDVMIFIRKLLTLINVRARVPTKLPLG